MQPTLAGRKLYFKNYPIVAGLALVIVVLDQWTKTLVREGLPFGAELAPIPALGDWITIRHLQNTGVAFGMFQGEWGWAFAALAAVVSLGILVGALLVPKNGLLAAALGLMLGGAAGNLIDRVTIGQVTDFLAIRYFAVINLADACLTVGVGLLILAAILEEQKKD